MKLTNKYISLLLSLCALSACSDEDVIKDEPIIPDSEKIPIELSVGGIDGAMQDVATRATSVITDEVDPLTFSNFDAASKLFMVMKSEWVSLPSGYENINFGGTHDTKYCVTRGEVAANQDKVVFNTGFERYWDDAHARSSKLSIWAFTAPGATYDNCTFGESDQIQSWKTTAITPTIKTWWVYKAAQSGQTSDDLITQNLCFSNNIVDYTSETKNDRRLGFKTLDKKFDSGKLVFYHAMSKITIHIKKGNGFGPSEPFAFKTNTTIALTNYNVYGTFDIADGKFSSTTDGDISKISTTSTATGDAFTLQALVIPGTTHSTNNGSIWNKDNTNTSMSFTINDNLYLISQDALITALRKNSANNGIAADAGTVEMEAGKHYIFTFTIGKKQIDNLTAQVVNWEEVEAEEFAPSNARITLNLEERGDALESNDAFSFYRAEDNIADSDPIDDNHEAYNWTTGFNTTGFTPTYVAAVSPKPAHWSTTWFWESNKHFYHFRALAKDNGTTKEAVSSITTDVSNGDYYTLTSAVNYNDILWGAPMKDVEPGNEVSDAATLKWNYGPETNGFDGSDNINFTDDNNKNRHQIYKAIGPTEDPVKLILFHMMSDLTINIKTTDGTDKVELCHDNGDGADPRYTRTRVDLVGFYNGGKVLLGSGLVKTTGDASSTASPVNIPFSSATDDTQYVQQVYKFGAVPQNLATTANNNSGVQLYITTPDNNQYIVDLKDVLAASTTSTNNIANPYKKVGGTGANKDKYIINRWYPGFKYTYSFTLAKTGITNLQATIVDWENVEADNETVQIK